MDKSKFYDKGYYAGITPEPRFKTVLDISKKLNLHGSNILDVGCGDGTFTALLKEVSEANEIIGLEISAEAVSMAKQKGINAIQLDIDSKAFPVSDASIDMVYCGEIIEHLFNTDHLLTEVYRVLKPGGVAIISTPNLAGWPNRFALLFGYQPYPMAASPAHESAGKFLIKGEEGQWGHIRVLTLRALLELLRLNKFKIVRVKGCPVTVKQSGVGLVSIADLFLSHIAPLATRVIVMVTI
jgi:methionine biosynthesis protein MetW